MRAASGSARCSATGGIARGAGRTWPWPFGAAPRSGSYTVVGPLSVGAALAGAPADVASALRAYGRPLGEAFQIRDDVLSTFGDPSVTGKDRDGDIRARKQTVLVANARRLAR